MTLKQVLKDFPEPLTKKAETAALRDGDKDSVLLHSVAEGVYYARRCCRQALADDELVSIVYEALSRAIKNFDLSKAKGGRFFSYGKIYIRGGIKREWTRRDVVRNSSSHETLVELDCGATDDGEDNDLSGIHSPSMRAQLHPDAEITTTLDFKAMETKELIEHLRPALKRVLTDREFAVVEQYYSDKGVDTFENIGRRLGVSRSAIEQTHRRALTKIRKHLEINKIA